MMRLIMIALLVSLAMGAEDRGLKLRKMAAEQRTALVVGNADYVSQKPLKNPVNDSRAIRDALQKLNFKVFYLENAGRRELVRTIDRFIKELDRSGVGLVYFAGHGVEVDNENYLIPVRADIRNETDIKYEAIAVNQLVQDMQQTRSRLNVLILDACRDNPYKRLKRGGSSGLANVEAEGFFVAFATAPGKTASDGSGNHGLFTKHFLDNINKPGLPLREVFHNVRQGVYRESNREQLPLVRNGIGMGEFYFTLPNEQPKPPSIAAAQQLAMKTPTQPSAQSRVAFSNFDGRYALTVKPSPADATVYITNIKPRYEDGIRLEPGSYDIKVVKNGYITKRGTVELHSDLTVDIMLEKDPDAGIPASGLEPAMVRIKRGTFRMGTGTQSNSGEPDIFNTFMSLADTSSQQQSSSHPVTFQKDFYISAYEVTRGEYNRCVKDGACRAPENGSKYSKVCRKSRCPVTGVSWHDAKSYAKWLSKKSGKSYRLPSESEWEYAARTGTTNLYAWGVEKATDYAWYYDNAAGTTHPVGTRKPNRWGLYDMYGNVWEWCEDWYNANYGGTPYDGKPNTLKRENYKVYRGGAWSSGLNFLLAAKRNWANPNYRSSSGGFRLAR